MKERTYFIYKYTFPNGKVYIGQTYKGSGRFGKPMKYRGMFVGKAMLKYPNYKKEILEFCSKEDVDNREKYYIELYDSTNRYKGYNREYGGNLHKQLTDDLRKELSRVHTDLQVTEIEQYTLDGVFVKRWKSIKEASTELHISRESISKNIHGKTKSAKGFVWKLVEIYSPYNKRPVSQYDLKGNHIKDWACIAEAEKELGLKNIINALNGRNRTAGRFQWKYTNSNKPITAYKTKHIPNGKHVFQYDLNGNFIKEWNSYLEAAHELNIPHQHIRRVLVGERIMTNSFIFRYDFQEKITEYNKETKSFWKPVEQYTLDGAFVKEWKSITEAQQALGIKHGIGKCCSGIGKTAGGFQWKYKEDPKSIISIIKPKLIKVKKPRPLPNNAKSVAQLDNTGKIVCVYSSIAEASIKTGTSISNISGCLKLRQKTAGGYRWEYVGKK